MDRKTGWSRDPAEGIGSAIRHVIQTVWQIVPGGIIRAGKTAYDDETNVGFWLGVMPGPDGKSVARLNLGGPHHSLRWTGYSLEVSGWFATSTVTIDDDGLAIGQGDDVSNQLRFVDERDETLGRLQVTGAGGPWLQLETTRPRAAGEMGLLDLHADGDFGANVRLRLETTRGGGPETAGLRFQVGNQTRMAIDHTGRVLAAGGFDAQAQRVRGVADALADDDALNRGSGDARYCARSAGWTGQFAVGTKLVTVVDGQIVAVS